MLFVNHYFTSYPFFQVLHTKVGVFSRNLALGAASKCQVTTVFKTAAYFSNPRCIWRKVLNEALFRIYVYCWFRNGIKKISCCLLFAIFSQHCHSSFLSQKWNSLSPCFHLKVLQMRHFSLWRDVVFSV